MVEIEGVDSALAVAVVEEPAAVFLVSGRDWGVGPLPGALEAVLEGPRCEETQAFTVQGRWVGESNLDDPFAVQIEVDKADDVGRRYLGLILTVLVDGSEGLGSRRDFRDVRLEDRLRARVRCVPGDRPTRTFAAESIEVVAPET